MGECLIIRSGGGTDTSNANATAAQVLSGYTCYVKDTKITGTMTNRGTVNQSLNPGGSYTIPVGYHSGSGKVTVSSLSANTSGTANAGRILSGRTAWVGGSRLTGTMTNRGAVSHSLAANGSYTIPVGWHNGSGKVNQSLTTQGAKSVTPKTTNQTACSANRWTTGTITIVGSSSLTAGNIKNGVWIFGVKGTFTGWVDKQRDIVWPIKQMVSGCTIESTGGYYNGNENWARSHVWFAFDESITRGWNVLWFWAGFGSQCTATIRTRVAPTGSTSPLELWHNQSAGTSFDENNTSYISIDNISLHKDGTSKYVRRFDIIMTDNARFIGLDTLRIRFHN